MVMAAVQAGVPVLGGNLPRAQMKQSMGDVRYDSHLPATGWQLQLDAIKEGHCGLLPESQFAPMARIQLARDESMAKVSTAAHKLAKPGQTCCWWQAVAMCAAILACLPGWLQTSSQKWP